MPVITLPDGSQRSFDHAVTIADVAMDIGPGLAKAALAGKINGKVVDLSTTLDSDVNLAIVTGKDDDALELIDKFIGSYFLLPSQLGLYFIHAQLAMPINLIAGGVALSLSPIILKKIRYGQEPDVADSSPSAVLITSTIIVAVAVFYALIVFFFGQAIIGESKHTWQSSINEFQGR